jgi:PAS domain S-box-containing protein
MQYTNKKIEAEKLAKVALDTHNPVMLTDYNGNIEWINNAYTESYGYSYDQLIAERGKSIFGKLRDPNVKVAFGKSILFKETVRFERKNITRSGSEIWSISTITPIIESEKVVQLIIIDSDITKQKLAEIKIIEQSNEIANKNTKIKKQIDEIQTQNEEIQAQNEEIQAQFEEIVSINNELKKLSIVAAETNNAIMIANPYGKIEWVNKGFEKLYGYSLKELKDNTIFSASQNPNIKNDILNCVNEKRPVNYIIKFSTKSGKEIWVQTTLTPILNENDEISSLIAIDSDITELKDAEMKISDQLKQIKNQHNTLNNQNSELEKYRNHLEDLVLKRTNELEKAKEKAEESDKLKSAFLANMSHEIRTPMNAIIAFSNLIIGEDSDKSEKQEFAEIINNSCETLLNLVDDIIDISKIEVGQLDIEHKNCNVSKILKEIYDINTTQNTVQPNVNFILNIPPEFSDISMHTDPRRLHQILSNLVSNALKFTDKGKVEFGYYINDENNNSDTEKKIVFFIKDTGIGIKEEEIPQIFERFRKFAKVKSKIFRGSGIGLAITKNLVELLDGEMQVKSQLDVGTEFHVSFKVELINPGEIQENKTSKQINKNKIYKWPDKTILIGEDEDLNYKFLEKVLDNTGVKIIWGTNGKEVIELFKENPDIDLVLLDVKMPILDGYEVIKEIRKTNKDIHVVAQTAYAMTGDKEKLINSGFNNYISKPIKLELLMEIIDGVLMNQD